MKVSHRALIIISGLIWFAIGINLLSLGLNFLVESGKSGESFLLISALEPFLSGPEQAGVLLIAIGLAIGYFKGKYVLSKSAHRGVDRVKAMSNPAPLSQIYSAKYYILLGLMVGLGLSIKYLGVPLDIRGLVDVAIGSALVNGSMVYFTHAMTLPKAQNV